MFLTIIKYYFFYFYSVVVKYKLKQFPLAKVNLRINLDLSLTDITLVGSFKI